jgi:hypothetical protein
VDTDVEVSGLILFSFVFLLFILLRSSFLCKVQVEITVLSVCFLN